jgi:glycine cleavage system pyridoxal-binding protein P
MSLTATALLLCTLASAGDAVLLKDNQHGFNQRWFSRIEGGEQIDASQAAAAAAHINLRRLNRTELVIALDERTTVADVDELLGIFGAKAAPAKGSGIDTSFRRESTFLSHPTIPGLLPTSSS